MGEGGQLWEGRDGEAHFNNRIIRNNNRSPVLPPSPSCFLESPSTPKSPLVNSNFCTHNQHCFPDDISPGMLWAWGGNKGTGASGHSWPESSHLNPCPKHRLALRIPTGLLPPQGKRTDKNFLPSS